MKLNKLAFYASNGFQDLLPLWVMKGRKSKLLNSLSRYDQEAIASRVNYYLKGEDIFSPSDSATKIADFHKKGHSAAYYYDLKEHLRCYSKQMRIDFRFGDDTTLTSYKNIVKARPVGDDNQNAVLMKLNKVRHFNFINDPNAFEDKKNMLIWRGAAYHPHRREFIRQFWDKPFCNIGQTNKPAEDVPWQTPPLSISEQLKYKFILCIEGNDVATNLKWAMSSNSLCMMTKPKFETWFMEGRLEAGTHYIELEEDYSNLESVIQYYSQHTEEAKTIIANANAYTEQFMNKEREELISLLVLEKYFRLSGQI